jgi:hypothetical protein
MRKALATIVILALSVVSALAQDLPAKTRPLSPVTAIAEYDATGEIERLTRFKDAIALALPPSLKGKKPSEAAAALMRRPGGVPNGALVGTSAGTVFWYSAASSSFEQLFSLGSAVRSLCLSGDQLAVSAVTEDGRAFLWKRDEPETLVEIVADSLMADGGGYKTLGSVALDYDGSGAIVTIDASAGNDSWRLYFLVDLRAGKALRRLRNGGAFAPDGKSLMRIDFDYDRKDAAGHPNDKYIFSDLAGNIAAEFSLPTNPSEWDSKSRREPKRRFDALKQPIEGWFALGWSEFGLQTLLERKDYSSSGTHFNVAEIVAGSLPAPAELAAYREDGHIGSVNRSRGLSVDQVEGDYGTYVISRYRANAADKDWSRKTRLVAEGGYAVINRSLVDEDQNALALVIQKYRPSEDFTWIKQDSLLRLLDWSSGKAIGKDVPLVDSLASSVIALGPDLGYVLFGTTKHDQFALYLPSTGALRSFDGTATYSGPGQGRFSPAPLGAIACTIDGKTRFLPAAPGQLGATVALAVDPAKRALAAVDEAGRLFLRDIASGTTLYSGQLAIRAGYILAPTDKLPLPLPAAPTAGKGAEAFDSLPALWSLNITKATDFAEPSDEK